TSGIGVTAAHCYHGVDEGGSVQLTFGAVVHPDPSPAGVFVPTTTTYSGAIHRALDGRDIAVVVLDDAIQLGRYAQLPALGRADSLPSNQRLDVVGFGWSAIKNGLQLAFGTKQTTTSNLASAGALSSEFVKVISGPCHGD